MAMTRKVVHFQTQAVVGGLRYAVCTTRDDWRTLKSPDPRQVTCRNCRMKLESVAYSMGGLADALTPMPGLVGGKLANTLEAMARGAVALQEAEDLARRTGAPLDECLAYVGHAQHNPGR